MKKCLVIVLLALGFILAISSSALADDGNYDESIIEDISITSSDVGIMPLRYSIINSISASLFLGTDNIASCSSAVRTVDKVYKIEITLTLQKFSGGKWTDWAQWSDYEYNTKVLVMERTAPYTSGSYRVYSEGTVTTYDGEEETQTCISDVKP